MLKPWIRWVIIILLAIVIIGGGLFLFINGVLNQIPRIDSEETFDVMQESVSVTESNQETENTKTEETNAATDHTEAIHAEDDIVSILLVGHNGRKKSSIGTTNTMILCTLNRTACKLTLTSFHSDMWVYIPGHGNQELCQSGRLGGIKLLNETLEHNFGVKIDHNIMVDFGGFFDVIDAVGGVEITLLEGEAKCLNNYAVREPLIDETWHLQTGKNTLTSTQSLAYVRMEELGTDFGRTNRQRIVISALLSKLTTMDISSAVAQTEKMLKMVATDMSNEQMIALLADWLPVLSNMETDSQNIPTKGTYSMELQENGNVLIMTKEQLEENRNLIASLYGK